MADKRYTQVGYRIRGIEPSDLAKYPDAVKKMYRGWVVQFGLRTKDKDLAAGLDKDGSALKPLLPESIKRRKSQVGPTFKDAPPLEPSYARSRVRSLLRGRAQTTSAEFWWTFDAVTGKSFAVVLRGQQKQGRDVSGLSPAGTVWVRAQALRKWKVWKQTAHVSNAPLSAPGCVVVKQPIERRPLKMIRVTGRTDLEHMDQAGDDEQIRRSIGAGQFSGFSQLNPVGGKLRPGSGVGGPPAGAGRGGTPPARLTTTQRQVLERALGLLSSPRHELLQLASPPCSSTSATSSTIGPRASPKATSARAAGFAESRREWSRRTGEIRPCRPQDP